jgi:hypothetical protein
MLRWKNERAKVALQKQREKKNNKIFTMLCLDFFWLYVALQKAKEKN